jgi:hypothetical protein
MKGNVGLWIDHRKAVIVSLTARVEKTMRIISHMERHVRYSGGSKDAAAEDHRDRRYTDHLYKYYDRVVSCIRGAEDVLIFGPGEAKGELRARLQSDAFGGQIACLEAADKMTDRQVAAKVRLHFGG